MKKITHFLSEGDHGPHHAWVAWASLSSCLPYSCSSPLWTVVCEFHFLIFLVVFLLLRFLLFFQVCVLDVLQDHIYVVLPSRVLVALLNRILVAPSLHSCCSKLTFLLHFLVVFLMLQAWILVVLLGHVLATPSSHSNVVLPSRVLIFQLAFFLLLINIPWITFFLLFINIPFFLNPSMLLLVF